jgi:CheY-like chemotaxis protein
MPGMDGYEVERRVRADPSCGTPAIVILSSLGSQQSGEFAVVRSTTPFLTKPVRQSVLLGTLARALEKQPTSPTWRPDSRPSGGATARRFEGRVLLVEDNLVNVKLALGILEKSGCEVSLAENGQRALELLQEESFDLIFMDIQMPIMGGLEATQRIRAGEQGTGARVPIVSMTAHAMSSDRDRCMQVGMDGYLTKPIRIAEVHAVLEAWLPERALDAVQAPVDPREGGAFAREGSMPTPSPSSLAAQVLDIESALRQLDGDRELFREALTAFLRLAPTLVDELAAALSQGDADALQRAAHSLKGSSAGIGARQVFLSAQRMEELGIQDALQAIPDLLAELDAQLRQLHQAAGAFLGLD